MTYCFSDIDTVRRKHVEPRQGDQASMAEAMGAPVPLRGGEQSPQNPPDSVEELLPPHPPIACGEPGKRTRGEDPPAPEEPHFIQGEEPIQGEDYPPPPVRLLSPNQTFADGLILQNQEEPPDPDPLWPLLQMPVNAILANEDYPTAEWPGNTPSPAEQPGVDTETVEMPDPPPEIAEFPEVCPDDSVSQAGRKPPNLRRELDLEDYRQDHGSRISH